jgi:hypothetical protein
MPGRGSSFSLDCREGTRRTPASPWPTRGRLYPASSGLSEPLRAWRQARQAGRAVDALEAMGSHEAEGTAAERGTNATQRGGEGDLGWRRPPVRGMPRQTLSYGRGESFDAQASRSSDLKVDAECRLLGVKLRSGRGAR